MSTKGVNWGGDAVKPVSTAKSIDELAENLDEKEIRSNMATALWGPSKVGKTRVICEAACHEEFQPCYVLETEFNLEKPYKRVKAEYAEKGIKCDVHAIYCKISTPGDVADDAIASLAKLESALFALSGLEGGLLAIDSGTDLWQWITLRLRKEVMNVDPAARIAPADYSWANLYYKKLMIMARAIDTHFIVTAHSQEVFRDARLSPTGIYKPVWQKETSYYADTEVRMEFANAKADGTPAGAYSVATIQGTREMKMFNKKMFDFKLIDLYEELKPYL